MQQELLVILRSSLADKQFAKTDEQTNKHLTPEEKLEEALANGSIQDFFPEVFKNAAHKMYLWQMQPGFSFLQLELGEAPLDVDIRYSITPHKFLYTKCFN